MGRRVRCLDGQGDAVHPLSQEQCAVSREPLRLRGVFRADDDERGVRGAGRSRGFQVAARFLQQSGFERFEELRIDGYFLRSLSAAS